MKKILLFISALAMLVSLNIASAANNLKIGVVDVQKMMKQIPQVTAMQKQLQNKFGPQTKKITAMQKQLRADLAKFNKNRSVMKDKDVQAMQKKIISEQDKLRALQVDFQQKAMAAQRKAMQSILDDVEVAVKKVANAQNLNLVLTKASIAYNDDDMDITDKVVKELKK
jgi:outer membrane protein